MKKRRKPTRRPKTIEVQPKVQRKFAFNKPKKGLIIQLSCILGGCICGYLLSKGSGIIFGGLLGLGVGKLIASLFEIKKPPFARP